MLREWADEKTPARVGQSAYRLLSDTTGVRDLVMAICCALHKVWVRLPPWQPIRLMLDSGVLHTLYRAYALDIKRLFPKMPHRSRSPWKACKNNLLRPT